METRNKYIEVVVKLKRLTVEDQIIWKKIAPPSKMEQFDDVKYYDFYSTMYLDKNLGIYRARYKTFNVLFRDKKWDVVTRLSFFTSDWDLEWTFPDLSAIDDLYSTVQYKTANVSDFVDKVLAS